MTIRDLMKERESDLEDVSKIADEIYDKNFQSSFDEQRALYAKLKKSDTPISDADLEKILIDIPLNLFDLSEGLNTFRLSLEVLKADMKLARSKAYHMCEEKSATSKTEFANMEVLQDNLLISIYESVINRVQNEISFTRELIMGAKKIWDARRNTSNTNPVGEPDIDNLPSYKG